MYLFRHIDNKKINNNDFLFFFKCDILCELLLSHPKIINYYLKNNNNKSMYYLVNNMN